MPRLLNTIGAKLLAAFLAMCAIIAAQGLYGYSVLTDAGDMVVDTFDRPLMAINYARAANLDFSQIERKLLERAAAPLTRRLAIDKQIDALNATFDDDLAVADARSSQTDEKTQIATIKALMAKWSLARTQHKYSAMSQLSLQIDDAFDLLIEYNTDQSFIARRKSVSAIAHFRYLLAEGIAASLLIAFLITLLLARRIGRPLSQAASVARNIAAGQFETPIPQGGDDETGALLHSMTVMQDSIRAMVTRETARAASAEGRLADALETSDEGVILVAPDGRIAVLNSRLHTFFPAVAHELVQGQVYAHALSHMRSQFVDVTVGTDEHRLQDGRWVRLNESPTQDGGRIVFVSDFTTIKEREERYRIAQLAAEAANAAKSRFLANMSHELRTPLNAIIGFSEVITHQLFGPVANARYLDYATDILRSGRHLLDVINSVLDLSKSEAGKLTLRAEPVDLRYVLKDCAKMVDGQCREAGIVFSASGLEAAHWVMGEKAKLRQIFLNLLSNAIKFTHSGGKVSLLVEDDNEAVLVRVIDTGIGMSPDEIKVALTAFGQVDNRLERKYEGTGLGLPLSKNLVELHGGILTVISAKDKGSSILVSLPRAVGAVDALQA